MFFLSVLWIYFEGFLGCRSCRSVRANCTAVSIALKIDEYVLVNFAIWDKYRGYIAAATVLLSFSIHQCR